MSQANVHSIWCPNVKDARSFLDILDYHIRTEASTELISYIKRKEREGKIVCFFGYPGLGKTATCVHAAAETNSLYIRFPVYNSNLTTSTDHLLSNLYQEFFKHKTNATVDDIISFISKVVHVVIYQLFVNASQKVLPLSPTQDYLDKLVISQSGMPPNFTYENLIQFVGEELSQHVELLLKRTKKDNIVLHLDECQVWAVDPNFDLNKGVTFPCYTKALDNYRLIGMINCLGKLAAVLPHTTVILSGTNIDCGKRVIAHSQVKEANKAMIMYSTVSSITQIVNHYCDLSHLPQEELTKQYKRLVGPTRLVQWFLQDLYTTTSTIPKNKVNFSHVHNAIGTVYAQLTRATFQHTSSKDLCNMMSILWEYPRLHNGMKGTLNARREWNTVEDPNSLINVIRYKSDLIPQEFMAYEDSGTVRWVDDSDFKYIVEPFPMLKLLWNERKRHYFTQEDIRLMQYAFRLKEPNFVAFQIAVCQVLLQPDSQLFKFVARDLYELAVVKYKVGYYNTEEELERDPSIIFMANDIGDGKISKSQMADIVFHVRSKDDYNELKRVRISVKMDMNTNRVTNSLITLQEKYHEDLCLLVTYYDVVSLDTMQKSVENIYCLTKLQEKRCRGGIYKHNDFSLLPGKDDLSGLQESIEKIVTTLQPDNTFATLSKIDLFRPGLGLELTADSAWSDEDDAQVAAPPRKKRKVDAWNTNAVIEFLAKKNLSVEIDIFRKAEIDGEAFLLLTVDMMTKRLGMKLGPALKLQEEIRKLKQQAT